MEKTINEMIADLEKAATPVETLSAFQRDLLRSQCVAMMFAGTQESVAVSSLVIFCAYGNSIVKGCAALVTDAIRSGGLGSMSDLVSLLGAIRQQEGIPASDPTPTTAKRPAKFKLVVDNTRPKRKPGRPRKNPVPPPAE